jgi:hypothetical protein
VFCDVIGTAGDIYFAGFVYPNVLEAITNFHFSINYG